MHVYYCISCKRYFFISGYWFRNYCKACGGNLILLPIPFIEFVSLDETARKTYIHNFLNK